MVECINYATFCTYYFKYSCQTIATSLSLSLLSVSNLFYGSGTLFCAFPSLISILLSSQNALLSDHNCKWLPFKYKRLALLLHMNIKSSGTWLQDFGTRQFNYYVTIYLLNTSFCDGDQTGCCHPGLSIWFF